MRKPQSRSILRATAKACGVSIPDLLGPSRARHIALARHVGMTVAFWCGRTYEAAAEMFGRSDHGTARHAKEKVEGSKEASRLFDEVLRLLGWNIAR